MGEMGFYPAGFYIWWMFLNGLLCFFEILFLQNLAGICKKCTSLPVFWQT